jgi:hypothetical protein
MCTSDTVQWKHSPNRSVVAKISSTEGTGVEGAGTNLADAEIGGD